MVYYIVCYTQLYICNNSMTIMQGWKTFLKTLLNGKNKKRKQLIKRKQNIPKTEKMFITKLKTNTKINYSIIHYYINHEKKFT